MMCLSLLSRMIYKFQLNSITIFAEVNYSSVFLILTFTSVCICRCSGLVRDVVEPVRAALTVHSLCVVLTRTPGVHLRHSHACCHGNETFTGGVSANVDMKCSYVRLIMLILQTNCSIHNRCSSSSNSSIVHLLTNIQSS